MKKSRPYTMNDIIELMPLVVAYFSEPCWRPQSGDKSDVGSVAAVDRLEEDTDGQLTGIDLWRSRPRLETAVTSPYGHDHGQAV